MSEWDRVPFSDLLTDSRDGEWGEGHEVVGHQLCEVVRGTDFENLNEQNIELPKRWVIDHLVERKRLVSGDIIFEMAGGTAKQSTGRSALLKQTFFSIHSQHPILCASFCRHLRLNRKRFDSAFVYYLLQTLYAAGYMGVFNIQHTGVSRFQYTSFKKHTVLDIPRLSVQRTIAATLSAYDDLIENNQRRITLLEKMAEEIYREWFVRKSFPGHEKVEFVKGVPDGWEVNRISEVVDFLSGYSFKSETYTPLGNYGVVTIKNVQDGYFIPECSDFIEDVPSNVKRHCYLECGDVLMSLTGNVGRVCHVYGNNLLLNQRVAKLASKLPNASQFIFFTFNNESMIQLIENLSLGSTAQMNLSPILLGKQKIVVPSNEMLKKYEDMTIPMFKEKMSLLQQNMLLQKTRDHLLPRLISGKLSVENLDIQFPPGMEETAHEI